MMKKAFKIIVVLCLLYLLFWPVSIDPVSWDAPDAPALEGKFAVNDLLKNTVRKFEDICLQCEDVDVDSNGYIYGGTEDGRILKLKEGIDPIVLAETHGRPLGIHFDSLQNLIVCDAQKGLLSVSPDGKIEVLATEQDGKPFLFTDDVDISKEGLIYFSDASDKFDNEHYKLDFIEHGANGRLLVYDPASKEVSLLLDGLYFANGVALSADESFVLVNETSAHRITRYWLKGDKKGSSDIFYDNLPFYPDGISGGENGIFWVAMMAPRNGLMDAMAKQPFLRKVIVRIPPSLMPKPKNYSFILGLNELGEVVYNLQDPDGHFAQITSIQQYGNKLYLGSLAEPAMGVFDLSGLQ